MLLQRSCSTCFSLLVLLALWELGMAAVMLTWSCNNCPYSTNVRSASNDDICILLRLYAPLTFRHSLPLHPVLLSSRFLSSCPTVFLSCRSTAVSSCPSCPSIFLHLCLPVQSLSVPLSSGPSVFQKVVYFWCADFLSRF
jgi:hypothetical protein